MTQPHFRRGTAADGPGLRDFYRAVFTGEDVGMFAKVLLEKYPGLDPGNWFILEDRPGGEIVAGLVLIPWKLEYCGAVLRTAEMGIVGTLPAYRKQGLQQVLNGRFDDELEAGGYDIAMIQGIPGFYHRFGYQYAIPLENHINLQLDAVGDDEFGYSFRPAGKEDIDWLRKQDAAFRESFDIAPVRDEASWSYLLVESKDTSYGSEFYILEKNGPEAYMRIPREGFGKGLIVSEMSESITSDQFAAAVAFCKRLAVESNKPYIRLNLHNDAAAAKLAYGYGVSPGTPYALQVKIPNNVRFIHTVRPVLEERLAHSPMRDASFVFDINLYTHHVVIEIERGSVVTVSGEAVRTDLPRYSCALRESCFEIFVLGHRSLDEIRHIFPDCICNGRSRTIANTLFPLLKGWLYEQY